MNKFKLKNTKALKEFESNVITTAQFINSAYANIKATSYFFEILGTKKRKLTKKGKKILNHLNVSLENKNKLFEMGFVCMFANFEFFMYSLLKELFKKYPRSLNDEKVLQIKEINQFKSLKDLKIYISDKYAIRHSYKISKWAQFLSERFDIKIFSSKDQKEVFEMMSELRNAYLHSGGNTNSQFSKNMGKILKCKVPMNEKIELNTEENFKRSFCFFREFIKQIKK